MATKLLYFVLMTVFILLSVSKIWWESANKPPGKYLATKICKHPFKLSFKLFFLCLQIKFFDVKNRFVCFSFNGKRVAR